jgi:signal transduction histidine kinase
VHRQEVDLTDLVKSESRAMQPLADRAGVRMSLVAEASAIAVNGNERHMRRVIANLIGNAVKFTPSGGTIECRVRALTPWAAIEVRDNGRGIAREFLPRVFEPFRQERSERRERKDGVGLGLHIVRDLVESHGGTVTAESAGIGCGATFTVLLPMTQAQLVRREHGTVDRHFLNVEVKRSDHGMR